MSDLKLPYTGEKLLELLENIKTEEELKAFIQQYSSSGGHTDEQIRIIVAEWYQQNNTQLTKADVDGWIEEYLAEHPVSGGGTSIDDSVTSDDKTWSSKKIDTEIDNVNTQAVLPNVVCFGDSISDVNVNGEWVKHIEDYAKFKSFKCYGRGNAKWTFQTGTTYNVTDTSNTMLHNNVIWNQFNRMKVDVENEIIPTPDVICIMAGTNDGYKSEDVGDIDTAFAAEKILTKDYKTLNNVAQSIRYVVEDIKQNYPHVQVILCTPIPAGTKYIWKLVKPVADMIKMCAQNMGLMCIDQFYESGISWSSEQYVGYVDLVGDGIHLTEIGGKKIASFLARQFYSKIDLRSDTSGSISGYPETKTYYSITSDLGDGITLANKVTSIEEGALYTTDVNMETGYTIGVVTVTMGGSVVSDAYSNGTITIQSVTGDIAVKVSSIANIYNVTKSATNAIINGDDTAIHGSSYSATITANDGYTLNEPTVTMGGSTLNGVYSNGTITIENVTAEIIITATAIEESSVVNATEITLSPTTVSFTTAGDTSTVIATLEPRNTTDTVASWVSDNESVATVENGVITSVANGTATITATTSNGLTATVEVSVNIATEPSGDTVFYSSKMGSLTFSSKTPTFSNDASAPYEYMYSFVTYIQAGELAADQTAGSVAVIIFSNTELGAYANVAYALDTSDVQYKVYYAYTNQTEAQWIEADSENYPLYQSNFGRFKGKSGNILSANTICYANYDVHVSNTNEKTDEIKFARNYNQSDYE